MSPAVVIAMPGSKASPPAPAVEVPTELIDLLVQQQRDALAQLSHLREHLVRQDEHLRQQDDQRATMWRRIDDVAKVVGVVDRLETQMKATQETVKGIQTQRGKEAAAIDYVDRFRRFNSWTLGIVGAIFVAAAGAWLTTFLKGVFGKH